MLLVFDENFTDNFMENGREKTKKEGKISITGCCSLPFQEYDPGTSLLEGNKPIWGLGSFSLVWS